MTLGPEILAEVAKRASAAYIDAESRLMQLAAKRMSKGLLLSDWAIRQLVHLQDFRFAADRILSGATASTLTSMREVVRASYTSGTTIEDLKHIGFGGVQQEALEALIRRSIDPVENALQRNQVLVATKAARTYREVVEEVTSRMLTGAVTRREAAADALSAWARRGVTGFTDGSGRNWNLASYAEMVTRTTANQSAVQGFVDTLQQNGHDLVMVTDAVEECKLCRPWEGKVLSLGNRGAGTLVVEGGRIVKVTALLSVAIGAGLFHPNCRHRLVRYVPGVTKRLTNTADPEGDKLRQRQRAYERRVRELKLQVEALKELGDTNAIKRERAKLRAKQAEFKDWREANDRKDLAYRTSLKAR